jgi:hypothetical protein
MRFSSADDVARRRRVGIVVAACVVLVGAGIAWRLVDHGSAPPPAPLSRVQPAAASAAVPAVRPATVSLAAPVPIAASAPRLLAPNEAEVCGIGPVVRSEREPNEYQALLAHRTPGATARWLDGLIEQGDERTRAAALLMRSHLVAEESTPPRPAPECGANAACVATRGAQARLAQHHAGLPWRERLVHEATLTRDPMVYALALQACQIPGGRIGDGACQLLSLAQWARLDPDNAIPWLQVAYDARRRGDPAAQDEALYRASQASRSMFDPEGLAGLLLAADTSELSEVDRSLLQIDAVGTVAAFAIPGLRAVNENCASPQLANTNRRQTCSALAELLVSKPGLLIDLGIGTRLGERLGWPAERVNALRRTQRALMGVQAEGATAPEALGCASLARRRALLIEQSHVGEVAALMGRLRSSGRSVDDVIAALDRAAASSASAPK